MSEIELGGPTQWRVNRTRGTFAEKAWTVQLAKHVSETILETRILYSIEGRVTSVIKAKLFWIFPGVGTGVLTSEGAVSQKMWEYLSLSRISAALTRDGVLVVFSIFLLAIT